MALLDDLVAATGHGGVFAGYSLREILDVVASLARHDHMRVHPDGRTTNKTQRRLLQTPFMAHHGLSRTQYDYLLRLYEGSDLRGFGAVVDECLPAPASGVGAQSMLVCRFFATDFGPTCCGRSMRVSEIDAVAHTVGQSFSAKHVVKRCVGSCKSAWYLNKRTYHEELGEDGITVHSFYPWRDGEPQWIASKSGKQIISTRLLTAFAMALCTMRYVTAKRAPTIYARHLDHGVGSCTLRFLPSSYYIGNKTSSCPPLLAIRHDHTLYVHAHKRICRLLLLTTHDRTMHINATAHTIRTGRDSMLTLSCTPAWSASMSPPVGSTS